MKNGWALRLGLRQLILVVVLVLLLIGTVYMIARRPIATVDGQTAGSRPGSIIQTPYGPLTPTDLVLLTKVRWAGLWEGPTAQQAMQRAHSDKVKEIGHHMAEEHAVLDKDDREVAAKLGVVLPTRPSALQEQWMQQLSGLSGDAYDRLFVHLLRVAHGQVFVGIAKVRASTGNSLVRAFADRCLFTVLRHMRYLESTGLVNWPKVYKDVT